MPDAKITLATIWEDSVAYVMARVVGEDGSNITQASINAIACEVLKKDDGTTVATPSITVSDVVFDTLQTDGRWTEDATGYNFRHALVVASFPDPDTTYRVQYVFTPEGGGGGDATLNFAVVGEITTRAML
jgi:hypothetical protein